MSESNHQDNWRISAWRVIKQLLREMGIPFIISTAWTSYSLVQTPTKRNIVDIITIFTSSFFFTCWGFTQWFQVKKQQAVESGLGGIVERQEALVIALTEATERLEGHSSGGKSIGWLLFTSPTDGSFQNITAHVHGAYPLSDARASLQDLSMSHLGVEEFGRTKSIHSFFRHHVVFNCGTLQPSRAIIQTPTVPYDETQQYLRFTVDWTARNGSWTQYIELKRDGGRFKFYTAVKREAEWVYENPQRDQIPKLPNGTPDVFWHVAESAMTETK